MKISLLRHPGLLVTLLIFGVGTVSPLVAQIVIRPIAASYQGGYSDTVANGFLPRTFNDVNFSSVSGISNGAPVPLTMPTVTFSNEAAPPSPTNTAGWGVFNRDTQFTPGNTIFTFQLPTGYEMTGIYLWNYTERYDSTWYNNRGVNATTLEFSTDGVNWFGATNRSFAMASESQTGPTYAFSPELQNFDAVTARFMRLTIQSNHGGGGLAGFDKIILTGPEQTGYLMQTNQFNAVRVVNNGQPPYAEVVNYTVNNAAAVLVAANTGSPGNTPGAASFQTFTTSGNGSTGSARPLQVGDTFTITGNALFNPSTNGYLGISFRDSTNYTDFFSSTDGATEARLQLDDSGNWKIYEGGTAVMSSGTAAGSNNVNLVIKITSSTTFDAQVGGTSYHNFTMGAGGGSIDSFSLYAYGDANPYVYWQNGIVKNTGLVELGYDLGGTNSRTYTNNIYTPGVITDGLSAMSTSEVRTNSVSIGGAAGSKVRLVNSNSYSGSTTVLSTATLELAPGGSLRFVIGGSGTNNAVIGPGIALFQGTFNFDLSAAATNAGSSWNVVAVASPAYDGGFQVAGFTNNGSGTWTRGTNGATYQFVQGTGVLSVAAGGDAYANWLTNYPSLTGTNTNSAADPDGDSFANGQEFSFGGNPTVGSPPMLVARKSGTNAVVSFVADTNALTYTVKSTTNLATGPWTNAAVTVTNSTDTNGILLPGYIRREFTAPATGRLFFRVNAQQN